MTSRKSYAVGPVVALGLLAAMTMPAAASSIDPTGPSQAEVRQFALTELARRNIAETDIRLLDIVTRLKFVNDDEVVDGYTAWTRVRGCDTGYVVVQMNRNGYVQQSYRFGGCNPPGFDS